MPKTRNRRTHRPAGPRRGPTRIDLVSQRSMAMLVNDLDDALRAVPAAYDASSIDQAVEHHHRCAAVVAFLRERNLVDTLARMAGGSMMVMPDADADGTYTESAPAPVLTEPAQTAIKPYVWMTTRRTGLDFHHVDQDDDTSTRCGRSTASVTSIFLPRASAEGSGGKPCPRCWPAELPRRQPGAAQDDHGQTVTQALPDDQPAAELAAVGAGFVARIAALVEATGPTTTGPATCQVCRRVIKLTKGGKIYRHGPREDPCDGSGAVPSGAPFGPVEVTSA